LLEGKKLYQTTFKPHAIKSRHRDHYCQNGYGLIEVLLIMAIVIILTVAAVPTFLDLYQRYHLSSTAQQLRYTLQYAKSAAIKNNQTIYFVFQTGDNWCYGLNAGATCNCSIANSCTLGTVAATKTQDLTLSLSSIVSPIQFVGVNGTTLTSGVIYFTIYGQSNAIGVKMNGLGNAKLCSSTLSGYPTCS
jgi:Tfp pilus assembly protein FimT